MAAAATKSSTFSLFSSLPRELRDQIWRDALPDKVGPALYFYRRGCWCPRRLSESDEGYHSGNDALNLKFEFRHDLLYNIQYETPLVFVNHEARGIALAWVREQGIEIRPGEDRQHLIFVRPFDPMRDALYIALDKWDEFFCEPNDRLSEPDLFEQTVGMRPDSLRIAIPEALLRSRDVMIREVLDSNFHVEVLFIVVDPQPDLQSVDHDLKVQRRCEFESTEGGACFWDVDRGSFDSGDGEYIGDDALYRLIERASKGLGEGLARGHYRSFKIRPVSAVRR